MKDKRIDFKVDQEMYDWIKEQAHGYRISMAEFIRKSIMIAKMQEDSYQDIMEYDEQHPKK